MSFKLFFQPLTFESFVAATFMGCLGGLYFLALSKMSLTSATNAPASWYFIASRFSATVLRVPKSEQLEPETP